VVIFLGRFLAEIRLLRPYSEASARDL